MRKGVLVRVDGSRFSVDLAVRPILDRATARSLLMVVFRDAPSAARSPGEARRGAAQATKGKQTAEDLQRELQSARESLQTTIEELQTSNEELTSTNEELQSTNEELQSTNEEMETSKEELQSLNEEAATVNAELQSRIDELSKANDDLKNLLDSTEIAALFLDADLAVRRFTPRATTIIPLAVTDAGRPIRHFANSLIDTDLGACAEQVLEDLALRESEVRSKDGRCFVMRVRPYRTVTNVIDGVVITFEDITDRKRMEEALRGARQGHEPPVANGAAEPAGPTSEGTDETRRQ